MKRQRTFVSSALAGLLVVVIAVLFARQTQFLSSNRLSPDSRGTPGAPILPTVHATASSTPIHGILMVDRLTPALPDICRTHRASSYTPTLSADATVDRLLPSHWLTPDGSRQVDPFAIVTPLHFSQMHLLRDGRNELTSEFIMPGGQVGQDQIIVDGFPQLLPNQRYLLFFEYVNDPRAQELSSKLLYVNLAFRITAQDMVIAQEREVVQGVVIQPEQTIPLAEIVARMKANCP